MEGKEKTNTAQLKRISAGIDASRKNIESDSNLIDNLRTIKTSFNDLEVVIKGQTPAFESMKAFSKEISSESSKNLQMKRYFNALCEKVRQDLRDYLEVVKQHFVISHRSREKENWEKMEKELDKSLTALKEDTDSTQKIYSAISRLSAAKDYFFIQFMRLMLYRKNVVWRDLNAPYDDYIHGDIKSVINLIKQSEEKYGYTPNTLEFHLPRFDSETNESSVSQLMKIVLADHNELIEGLKNYSKLSEQPQVIEDISKNQHIVHGLREKIELLSKNYEGLMDKYRSLQISKGKAASGSGEEKSLTEKIEEYESQLIRKEQEILDLKQAIQKSEGMMNGLKDKNKELQEQLSKWHKYQLPKIKEMEGNQKSLWEEFNKVKRDLETYTGIVQNERQQKLKTIEDLKVQKNRVTQLVTILGRERRKIKQLKNEIIKQDKIMLQIADRIPN